MTNPLGASKNDGDPAANHSGRISGQKNRPLERAGLRTDRRNNPQ
jgi:hypothetical protein